MKEIHIAPVQGHTDAAWRFFHSRRYGMGHTYYTPFIRLEHGEIRQRDLRDAFGELTEECGHTVPQVIFKDGKELTALVARIKEGGATRIDINMGCPFPLQTSKGRGAATIAREECREAVRHTVEENPDVDFSVKMRLGYSDPEEWKELIPVLNGLTLRHITVHPRVARQQYGGELDMEQMSQLVKASEHPVVFSGEIKTPADAMKVMETLPDLGGIMLGRGLLGRPSLAAEIESGNEWDRKRRIEEMLGFHRVLMRHYEDSLCGDHQLLSKIKPFWEYAEEEIGRKAWKAIRKSVNMAKYHSAVAMVGSQI